MVLFGDATRIVRGQPNPDASIPELDVGVMLISFGQKPDGIDERKPRNEIRPSELRH